MNVKGIEEIKALLQTWPEGFKHTFGREITKEELMQFLKNQKAMLEQKSMAAQFSTYNPVELQLMYDYLKENDVPNVPGPSKKKGK